MLNVKINRKLFEIRHGMIMIPNPGLNQSQFAIFRPFRCHSSLRESLRKDVTPNLILILISG